MKRESIASDVPPCKMRVFGGLERACACGECKQSLHLVVHDIRATLTGLHQKGSVKNVDGVNMVDGREGRGTKKGAEGISAPGALICGGRLPAMGY